VLVLHKRDTPSVCQIRETFRELQASRRSYFHRRCNKQIESFRWKFFDKHLIRESKLCKARAEEEIREGKRNRSRFSKLPLLLLISCSQSDRGFAHPCTPFIFIGQRQSISATNDATSSPRCLPQRSEGA